MKKKLITLLLCGLLVILTCGFTRSDVIKTFTEEELHTIDLDKSVVITVKETGEEIIIIPLKGASDSGVAYSIESALAHDNLTEDDVTISSLE